MFIVISELDKLSENFKDLFNDKETYDTTLKVQEMEYKVHRCVLIARSSVFAATFRHDTLEKQTGVINIPDCDPDSFQEFLQYLYCGELELLSFRNALNLYCTSDKYNVQEVKIFCVDYLMRNLTVQNLCEIVVFADKYGETILLTAVQDFFNKNVCEIFETSEWECFLKQNNHLANKLLKEMAKVKLKM